MAMKLSDRLAEIVDALPLVEGMRVLEIGCGSGAAARPVSQRIGSGFVLAIDRSANAIQQAIAGSQAAIRSGKLKFRQVAVEDFALEQDEALFDMAFGIWVGALDGRHPELEKQALKRIAKALKKHGRLFIDGGAPLKEILLERYRREG